MKILLLAVLPLYLLRSNIESSNLFNSKQPSDGLQPTATHKKVEEAVTRILTNYAYKKIELDDELSSKIWDSFLKDVDYGHLYFTENEIKSFEKYRYQVDNSLMNGDLKAPYEVFNLFLKKYKERSLFINSVLDQSFDFNKDEYYESDSDKLTWAKSDAELDENWRKLVKSQALDLKLSGKADSTISKTLKNRYKNIDKYFSKLKSEQVFQIYMNAFAESVDPHTNYFSPASAENFKIDMAQSLEGIGALLTFENDYVKIAEVIPGGPAFKGKQLAKDDRIVGVAQGDNTAFTDIIGWTTEEAVKLIRGPKGSVVRLQVLAADAPASAAAKEYRLVREKVKLEDQVAKSEVVPFKQNGKEYNIGVITIPLFYRDFEGAQKREMDFKSTTRDVSNFLTKFEAQKVDGVIIDLRNNGGGSLTEAINLSGLFISKGPVVQQREATGEIQVHEDLDPNQNYNGPLAVLVNRFSASASEIFAGAIQDYKRGLVLGEQTFGKGTVQSLIDLNQFLPKENEQLGQLKLTMAKFYRITGSSTQHKGVTPDIEFPSGFSAKEYGESAMPTALPWDQINGTKFSNYPDVTDKLLAALKGNYSERLKTDSELKKLESELNEFKKLKEKTLISLKEDIRKKERDDYENKKKASKTTSKDGKEADIYLKESERILSDYIVNFPGKKVAKEKGLVMK
ncbi:MAG: carboxy terminal-processing peptidase [Bacteroidota bacterium]